MGSGGCVSKTGKPFYTSGDKHFNPPKSGMLVFDHANPEVQSWWANVCLNFTKTGVVDGCFSDSSQPGTHGTKKALNSTDAAAFEAGKVKTMTTVTAALGGKAGKPFA